MTRAREPLFK